MLSAQVSTIINTSSCSSRRNGRAVSPAAPRGGQARAALQTEAQASVRCRGLIRGYNCEATETVRTRARHAEREGAPGGARTAATRLPRACRDPDSPYKPRPPTPENLSRSTWHRLKSAPVAISPQLPRGTRGEHGGTCSKVWCSYKRNRGSNVWAPHPGPFLGCRQWWLAACPGSCIRRLGAPPPAPPLLPRCECGACRIPVPTPPTCPLRGWRRERTRAATRRAHPAACDPAQSPAPCGLRLGGGDRTCRSDGSGGGRPRTSGLTVLTPSRFLGT